MSRNSPRRSIQPTNVALPASPLPRISSSNPITSSPMGTCMPLQQGVQLPMPPTLSIYSVSSTRRSQTVQRQLVMHKPPSVDRSARVWMVLPLLPLRQLEPRNLVSQKAERAPRRTIVPTLAMTATMIFQSHLPINPKNPKRRKKSVKTFWSGIGRVRGFFTPMQPSFSIRS